jgi:hypothetical protein
MQNLFLINVSVSTTFNEPVVEPLYDLGPIEELCNQGENPKQNHHCTLPEHSQNQLEFPPRSSHLNKLSVAIKTHTSEAAW